MRTLAPLILSLSILAADAPAGDSTFYRKAETWQKTVQGSMEALTLMRQPAASRGTVTLGPWLAIGPFPATTRDAFAEVFAPEKDSVTGKGYGNLRWLGRPEWRDGAVTLFDQTDFCAMFLSRTVASPRDTTITLSLGSDDGIKLWLDGRLLLQHDVNRPVEPDQEELDVRLTPGTHRLLLKINNGTGDFGYYFALVDREMRTLWRLVARDFPGPREEQQMAWEMQDSIWSKEWRPGDVSELAARYASFTIFDRAADRDRAIAMARQAAGHAALDSCRERYIQSREEEMIPHILTPTPPATPRINGARIFGVRPGHPVLYTIAATGQRPMSFHAHGLPAGLSLDETTGRITGALHDTGTSTLTIEAHNSLGTARRTLRIVSGGRVALTPPMGWNSWNCFASAVDDSKVRAAADAMVKSGLVDHGWTYINIDDCWEVKPGSIDSILSGEPRTREGKINTNRKFPSMKALGDYVHDKGLKLGIYSSPGPLTCAGFTASYGFERQDAAQYADWGIDYLKYDWCSYGSVGSDRTLAGLQKPYRVMREALDKVNRDVIFSLCQYGMGDVWKWGGDVGGNSWRTTGDIADTWESMSTIGFSQAGHEKFAKPGNWNDPDMLVVGMVGWGPQLHPTQLTPHEQYTHITLWSLLCAPLLIGCDMTQMDGFTLSLLTNDEVIAVSQDPLGRQAARVSVNGDIEVWAKEMEDGSKAVGLFNRGKWKSDVAVSWSDLGLSGKQVVRDLWREKDLGTFADGITLAVPRHGTVLLRVGPPNGTGQNSQ